jgi:hypothetical protein
MFAAIGILTAMLILGTYFAYGIYAEDKYYENYRIAQFYGDKEDKLLNDTYNKWDGANGNVANLKNMANVTLINMQTANDYEIKYQHYVNEMIKYADSNVEKQYAVSMLEQSNYSIQDNKAYIEIVTLISTISDNNQAQPGYLAKLNELTKKRDILGVKMDELGNKREKIRAQYPNFSKRLDQEYEASKKM